MKLMPLRLAAARYARSREGVSAPLVALFIAALVGAVGYSIDMGHVLWIQRELQKSVNAAALAGATQIVDAPGSATSFAQNYGATGGGKNVIPGVAATNVSGYPRAKCFTSITYPACTSSSGYNGIQVSQQAVVPMWFLSAVGFPTMTVTATATASARGGKSIPLDVMIVLDNTGSMNDADHNCSGGSTKIACAKYGVQQLLLGLNPTIDKVGIMVFPGYTSQPATLSTSKCKVTASISSYDVYNRSSSSPYFASAPYYTVSNLDNSFKSSATSKTLSGSSSVVIAVGGGSTCGSSSGFSAVGGKGTYYAQAIMAAQNVLQNDGSSSTQKVIVLLSDGNAGNASNSGESGDTPTAVVNGSALNLANQCQQGVAAAQYAAAQGTWVYSIAYGASTTKAYTSTTTQNGKKVTKTYGTCQMDTSNLGTGFGNGTSYSNPGLSACDTMTAIASEADKFYSDGAKGCSAGAGHTDSDLVALFKDISNSFAQPRLIPNDAT